MNKTDTMAFMQKMMQAKQTEAEALMLLIPKQARGHMKVIGKELNSMIEEYLTNTFLKQEENEQEKTRETSKSGIRKVGID